MNIYDLTCRDCTFYDHSQGDPPVCRRFPQELPIPAQACGEHDEWRRVRSEEQAIRWREIFGDPRR